MPFTFWDFLDILIFALCLFYVYKLIRGTVALYIVAGILLIYGFWWLFQALDMNLMSTLLGRFSSIGIILLVIIFQPEIRRFLLLLGSNMLQGRNNILRRILRINVEDDLVERDGLKGSLKGAIKSMASRKTGALIILAKEEHLNVFKESGVKIDAKISQMLIESIFEKTSPLHDGAMILLNKRIYAASCILPLSYDPSLPLKYGLRHRAAIGATEMTDIAALVVSEESGTISYVVKGEIKEVVEGKELEAILSKHGYS
jgi:diadenylate cyclase